jgi:hypothetical protein
VIAELHRHDRDDFVARRDEVVRRLRSEGRRDDAAEIRALRKPTAAAWVVNQLSQEAKGDVAELLRVGGRMRKAKTPKALREAAGDERDAIGRLMARAEDIAGRQSAATMERVRETLHAAAVDEDVGGLVAAGRLTVEQRAIGFGAPGALRTDPAAPKRAAADTDDRRQRRELQAAQRRVARAESAHQRATDEAARAPRELERAAAELEEARAQERAASAR